MKDVPFWSPTEHYKPGELALFGGAVWRKRPEPGLWDPWTWIPPTQQRSPESPK